MLASTMIDSTFEIGEVVVDSDASTPVSAIVVALPATTAGDWLTYGGTTVAQANPASPADAPIAVVVDADDVDTYLPEWDHTTSLSRTALDETGVYYQAVPTSLLETIENADTDTPSEE
jgi:hypothetical protein